MARDPARVGRRAAAALKTEGKKESLRLRALRIPAPASLHANQGTPAAGGPTSLGSRAEGSSGRCPFGPRTEVGQRAVGLALVWVVFPGSLASPGTSRASWGGLWPRSLLRGGAAQRCGVGTQGFPPPASWDVGGGSADPCRPGGPEVAVWRLQI